MSDAGIPRSRTRHGHGRVGCVPLLGALLVAACPEGPGGPSPCLAPVPLDEGPLRAERMAAGIFEGAVRVRGHRGAAPAAAELEIQSEGTLVRTRADEGGRFDMRLPQAPTLAGDERAVVDVVWRREGDAPPARVSLRVRRAEDGACVVASARATGTTPNHVSFGSCAGLPLVWVIASSDGALSGAPLVADAAASASGATPGPLTFPVDAAQRGANPWAMAWHAARERAALTLFGQHTVVLVAPCEETSLARFAAMGPQGAAWSIAVDPPILLDAPLDADGDGAPETEVTRMRPRHPQGVAFVGERVIASFTNALQLGVNPRFGPGVLMSFNVEGDRLEPQALSVLPCKNPQSIRVDEQGQPWVSCSGVLGPSEGSGAFAALSEGALLRIDPTSLEVVEHLPLGRFAPGSPGFDEGHIVVGSLVRPEVALRARSATAAEAWQFLPLAGAAGAPRVESLFDTHALGGALFAVTEYSGDRIHILDAADAQWNPWPAPEGIRVGPGGLAFRGVQALSLHGGFRHGDDTPDAAALLSQSHELVMLRLWQLWGP